MDTESQSHASPAAVAAPTAGRRGRRLFIVSTVMLLTAWLGFELWPHGQRPGTLAETVAPPPARPTAVSVQVVTPKRSAASSEVLLPGNVQALQEASIYARTSGYVQRRLVDIGDRVSAGQLLAAIEAPEVDQELLQARATLLQVRAALGQARASLKQMQANVRQAQANAQQVRANADLARTTAERWWQLEREQVVPRQQAEEKQAAFAVGQANVHAAQANVNAVQENVHAVQAQVQAQEANVQAQEANVRRLETLQSFQKVTAPFAGVITARNVEIGALVTAGSGTTSRELFRLAQIDTLRVFVNVPQNYIAAVHTGQSAQVQVRELPQKTFAGKVVRTSSALDAASRTLAVEVQVGNADQTILPGMYAEVKLATARATPPVLVPSNALVIRADGPQVAMVQSDQTVRYQKVKIERDYGTEVEISAGLQGDEALVVNPTNALRDGMTVQTVAMPSKAK
ncbi:MAG: efflux RND transporter periplasmic adaptor subunit [Candidatus Tectimicrobiota bacterium]